ncbi:hypothetical protein PSACC_02013 [Paramicrosporidium saccamoebae]|uniref:Peptidase A1 domain-containing protein n=1 Tax=Paramicrosporidium saccamoebae TaxID=1246581 RepID=A0A2H9TKA1_9FUNG|nr:hypothetical protein PSACC_02013 [Paramicrosporidium saccamoebae]
MIARRLLHATWLLGVFGSSNIINLVRSTDLLLNVKLTAGPNTLLLRLSLSLPYTFIASSLCMTDSCLAIASNERYNGNNYFTASSDGQQRVVRQDDLYALGTNTTQPMTIMGSLFSTVIDLNFVNALRVLNMSFPPSYVPGSVIGVFGMGLANSNAVTRSLLNPAIYRMTVASVPVNQFGIRVYDQPAADMSTGDQTTAPATSLYTSVIVSNVPVWKKDGTWNFELLNFSVGIIPTGGTGQAILTTDTNLIYIPKAAGAAMAALLGATVVPVGDEDHYTIPCLVAPSKPNLFFATSQGSVSIPYNRYIKAFPEPCEFYIIGKDMFVDGVAVWLLGMQFIRTFYTWYTIDAESITFAAPAL